MKCKVRELSIGNWKSLTGEIRIELQPEASIFNTPAYNLNLNLFFLVN
jgi:hypothetical protein